MIYVVHVGSAIAAVANVVVIDENNSNNGSGNSN